MNVFDSAIFFKCLSCTPGVGGLDGKRPARGLEREFLKEKEPSKIMYWT